MRPQNSLSTLTRTENKHATAIDTTPNSAKHTFVVEHDIVKAHLADTAGLGLNLRQRGCGGEH